MTNRRRFDKENELNGWFRPRQTTQRTLFPEARDGFLARIRLSLDELERWQERGWLSFDARSMTELDEPETTEILFVRNLAHSGLPDAIINTMLETLPKPYSYDPLATAFNFIHGWVALPPFDEEDVDRFMDDYLEEWTKAKLESGDMELLDKVYRAVFQQRLEAHRVKKGADE